MASDSFCFGRWFSVILLPITLFLVACQDAKVHILVFNSTDYSYTVSDSEGEHTVGPRQRLFSSIKRDGSFEVGFPGRTPDHSYSTENSETLKDAESRLFYYCGDRQGLYLVDETNLYFDPNSQMPKKMPEFKVIAEMKDVDFVPIPSSCVLEDGEGFYSLPRSPQQVHYRLIRVSPDLSDSEARVALKAKLESWWLKSKEEVHSTQ